jgi:hypothetical protein
MLTAQNGDSCRITDSLADPRLEIHAARDTVRAYCAVLLRYADGGRLGTLCHFDVKAHVVPPGAFEDLERARPAVERFLLGGHASHIQKQR